MPELTYCLTRNPNDAANLNPDAKALPQGSSSSWVRYCRTASVRPSSMSLVRKIEKAKEYKDDECEGATAGVDKFGYVGLMHWRRGQLCRVRC